MNNLKTLGNQEIKLCIIGLGYVGLPLAAEFAKHFPVTGFDIKKDRIAELESGHDSTLEVEDDTLKLVLRSSDSRKSAMNENGLVLTSSLEEIRDCNIFIVTVPTPVNKYNHPDLTPLIKASESIGRVIKQNDIIIYESTVYPGCTEEDCIPVIEKISGKKMNDFFFGGYSPERINPGDKEHTVTTIRKVTSGSTPEVAEVVDRLYRTIITAGTHMAPSIKIAEMAKVIENSQRDINIAFVNEIARICYYMGIDTTHVLEAAGSKWNFLKFKPGLVGGHCIGVDPYYLSQKAQEMGYNPEIILAGRRMNDGMAAWVAACIVKLMIEKSLPVKNSKVLVLGITFKENCPDIRNSKVVDLVKELKEFGCDIDILDPWADSHEVKEEYGIDLLAEKDLKLITSAYDTVILAVAHKEFTSEAVAAISGEAVLFDMKSHLDASIIDARL